jgi:serine acetyltransferase
MQVGRTFLEKHLEKHTDDRTVVLGRLRPDAKLADMPLFERFYARVLANKSDAFAAGKAEVRGHDIYTGNVSFPRAMLLGAGGFDPRFRALEDEELGIRLEKAGARFAFANEAESMHGSDWTSMQKWMERAYRDGVYQTKVARKHPDHPESSPWRHLPNLNPVSRPFMALSLALPGATSLLAGAAIRTAATFDKIGKGARGHGSAWAELVHGVREDHRMMRYYAERYDAREQADEGEEATASAFSMAGDAVKKIGFQLMIAYRVMRFFRAAGLSLAAQFMSRAIRHAFASDVHWDAELEPGVVIVHGFGLAISYVARVRSGCILFQNVTLGFGLDPETKESGGPLLEKNVHVGIGATLFGPITVGEGTKIMAGCVLNRSVPPRSIVEAPVPHVAARRPPPKRG